MPASSPRQAPRRPTTRTESDATLKWLLIAATAGFLVLALALALLWYLDNNEEIIISDYYGLALLPQPLPRAERRAPR